MHLVGVAEGSPGEAAELIDPLLLEGLTLWNHLRPMDRQVGEVDGFGRAFRRGPAALVHQELAQPPLTNRESAWSWQGGPLDRKKRALPAAGEPQRGTERERRRSDRTREEGPGPDAARDSQPPASRQTGTRQQMKSCSFCSADRSTASRRSKARHRDACAPYFPPHEFKYCSSETHTRPGRNVPGFSPGPQGITQVRPSGSTTEPVSPELAALGLGPPSGSRTEPVSAQRKDRKCQNCANRSIRTS